MMNKPTKGWSASGGKVLFISYYFPPIGGIGAIRTAKFVKFLPKFGWQPYILTVKKGFHPFYDESLLEEIKEAKISKINYFEPLFWFRQHLWQSFLNYLFYPLFLIPDRQILWVFPALKAAQEIIQKEKIDLIFTSSAPASDHLIGYFLKKTTGVKWVADFRDEWSNNPLRKFPTPLHRYLNKILEKKIVQKADQIISVAPSLTHYLAGLSGDRKFQTITNGFDSDDFRDFKDRTNKKFCQILYTGSLYDYHLQKIFLEALSELDLKNLKVDFIGLEQRVSHKRAVRSLSRADILLLLLDPQPRPAVFTGKLFEYLAAKKPILALAPSDSGAARLIKRLKVGEVANPLDKEEIKIKTFRLYQLWQKNKLRVPTTDLTPYERKNLTGKLANIFEGLTRVQERKIKLCLIGNLESPQNQSLVDYFRKRNYEIHFISTKPAKIPKVKDYYLASSRYPVLSTACYFFRSLYRIRRFIKEIKPDIVHGQDLVFAGIWARFSGVRPVVVTSWGSDVMNYDKFISAEKYLIRKTLQGADLVTGTSLAIKNQAIRIGMAKEKFSLVHFGIDLGLFRAKNHHQNQIIFCPRAIAPVYNTDILIQAFSQISKKNPKIKLALLESVTDERYLIEIEKLIIRLGLVDKVEFWRKVPNKEMADYYNKAEVVVSISSSDGCSVSFLEAMASESKIVATNLPYLKEWYKDKNLWLVPIRDVEATAKAILAAFKFPKARWRKIGEANRQQIAQKAEIKSNFEKLDRLYRELI